MPRAADRQALAYHVIADSNRHLAALSYEGHLSLPSRRLHTQPLGSGRTRAVHGLVHPKALCQFVQACRRRPVGGVQYFLGPKLKRELFGVANALGERVTGPSIDRTAAGERTADRGRRCVCGVWQSHHTGARVQDCAGYEPEPDHVPADPARIAALRQEVLGA